MYVYRKRMNECTSYMARQGSEHIIRFIASLALVAQNILSYY